MAQADITIIGTAHVYQIPGKKGAGDFEQFIVSHTKGRAAIVEELSRAALRDYDAAESVGMRVADRLSLCHLRCDPDEATRASGKMQTHRILKLNNDMALRRDRVSEEEVEQRAEDAWHRRENYWLDRMFELSCWPILFICGAWHVSTFAAKARERELSVEIAESDWPDRASVPQAPWLR